MPKLLSPNALTTGYDFPLDELEEDEYIDLEKYFLVPTDITRHKETRGKVYDAPTGMKKPRLLRWYPRLYHRVEELRRNTSNKHEVLTILRTAAISMSQVDLHIRSSGVQEAAESDSDVEVIHGPPGPPGPQTWEIIDLSGNEIIDPSGNDDINI